jgi:tetratricopeptide (TPR) repeat protein
MKQLIIVVLLVLQASFLFAQQEKRDIRKGNQLYQAKNYKQAEDNYRKALAKSNNKTVEGNFNLGDALYKQKKFEDAQQQFTKIAATSKDKQVLANAYHNIGNSLLENKKLDESIAAYKKSLLNNPNDEQTRYNLSYAQKMLKKQQDDKKNQNKNDKNKDKYKNKDKNKDDKNKDKDNKDKDKKDQDKKDQDKKDKDNKDKNKPDNKDPQDQQQQQPQPNNVSKDDAERMLEALKNDEKATQDKLKNKKLKGARTNISKDW